MAGVGHDSSPPQATAAIRTAADVSDGVMDGVVSLRLPYLAYGNGHYRAVRFVAARQKLPVRSSSFLCQLSRAKATEYPRLQPTRKLV